MAVGLAPDRGATCAAATAQIPDSGPRTIRAIGNRIRTYALALAVLAFGGCAATEPAAEATGPDLRPEARQGPRRAADDVRYLRERGDEPGDGLFDKGLVSLIAPHWFPWKHKVEKATRFDFGLAYTSLFQKATDSIAAGPDYAGGGDFDIFGQWHAYGEGGNAGVVGFAFEDRHKYGAISPSQLGTAIGSLWPTTRAFDTHKFALIQLFWDQHIADDRVKLRVGFYDHNNIYDTYTFRSEVFYFQNQMFAGNVTFNLPGGGFGGVVNWRATEEFYIGAGIADANGSRASPSLSSFFTDREYYYILEFGFSPRPGPFEIGHYDVTVWHVDERVAAGVPSGSGVTVNLQHAFGDLIPFLRYAWSDATAPTVYARQNANGGLGIMRPFGRADDVFAFGVGAGEEVDGTRWQVGSEAFYRLQLTPYTQLTLSIQGIFNPLYGPDGPDQDVLGVFGLRLRFQL
jgi:porin